MTRRTPQQNALGPLSANSASARHWVPAPLNLPTPTRVVNSMQPNMSLADARRYLPRPYIREGADHSHIKSKGW